MHRRRADDAIIATPYRRRSPPGRELRNKSMAMRSEDWSADRLPNELLVRILRPLPVPVLWRLQRVSRRWRLVTVLALSGVQRLTLEQVLSWHMPVEHLRLLLVLCQRSLRSLVLWPPLKATTEALSHAGQLALTCADGVRFPALERLELNLRLAERRSDSVGRMLGMLRECPALQRLRLCHLFPESETVLPPLPRRLETLQVQGNWFVRQVAMRWMAEYCGQLRSLTLPATLSTADEAAAFDQLCGSCTRLQELELRGNLRAIQLRPLPQLTVLKLSFSARVTDGMLRAVPGCFPALRHLFVSDPEITAHGLQALAQLRHLRLLQLPRVRSDVSAALCSIARNGLLEMLDIENALVDRKCLTDIISQCRNMNALTLSCRLPFGTDDINALTVCVLRHVGQQHRTLNVVVYCQRWWKEHCAGLWNCSFSSGAVEEFRNAVVLKHVRY